MSGETINNDDDSKGSPNMTANVCFENRKESLQEVHSWCKV